jgi:uncharacterized membrane protein
MAIELGLLPNDIKWEQWTTFVTDFLSYIDIHSLKDVSDRYKYGELRLTRLNTIYRLFLFSGRSLVSGYMPSSTWYKSFFARNFAWLLAVFAYFTVVLSALQVGLATNTLQKYDAFQSASYGFAVTSVVTVAASVFLIFVIWLFLFVYHLHSTREYNKKVARERSKCHDS